MPSDRPTRAALRDRVLADLSSAIGDQRAMLRRSVERALAIVAAGLADGLWARLEWLEAQLLPDRCDEQFLARWAALYRTPRNDGEALDDWRARVLHRIGNPPRGGAQGDYAAWARSVAGVQKAWEIPLLLGPGSVGVLFAALDSDGAYAPDATHALRQAVQDALDDHKPLGGIRPVAIAPSPRAIDLEIRLRPLNASTRAAVTLALRQFFAALTPGQTVLLSQLRRVIGAAPGVVDHRVLRPTTDTKLTRCAMPVLGQLTFLGGL